MPPVFFWRPEEEPYGNFSQWYRANLVDNTGTSFPTAEHYMMFHKALLFDDRNAAQQILQLSSPRDVRAAGRKIRGFSEPVWDQHRFRIAYEANKLKFDQSPQLKAMLQQTQGRQLVEASPSDRIWGIGFSAADASAHTALWGQNLLGKALEAVRNDFLSDAESS